MKTKTSLNLSNKLCMICEKIKVFGGRVVCENCLDKTKAHR